MTTDERTAVGTVLITYIYAQAFTECDCGNPITLSQRGYGDPTYTGKCKCGKGYSLLHGNIWLVSEAA